MSSKGDVSPPHELRRNPRRRDLRSLLSLFALADVVSLAADFVVDKEPPLARALDVLADFDFPKLLAARVRTFRTVRRHRSRLGCRRRHRRRVLDHHQPSRAGVVRTMPSRAIWRVLSPTRKAGTAGHCVRFPQWQQTPDVLQGG